MLLTKNDIVVVSNFKTFTDLKHISSKTYISNCRISGIELQILTKTKQRTQLPRLPLVYETIEHQKNCTQIFRYCEKIFHHATTLINWKKKTVAQINQWGKDTNVTLQTFSTVIIINQWINDAYFVSIFIRHVNMLLHMYSSFLYGTLLNGLKT